MIKFNKIVNGDIFTRDFKPLTRNNEIHFPSGEEIAVIYAPNGTGKTSLVKVLSNEKDTKIEFEIDDNSYTSGEGIFHIINDQNNRNIIKGETKDFFLGDDIKREFELQDYISKEREELISGIVTQLKAFGISATSSPLIDLVRNQNIVPIIKDIANNKQRGNKYSAEDMVEKFISLEAIEIPEIDESKMQYLQKDIADKASIIKQIKDLSEIAIPTTPKIHQIEENDEAINILDRFRKDQCIVCDAENIDWESLINSKRLNRNSIIEELGEELKPLIERIIKLVPSNDPFNIKKHLFDTLNKGNNEEIITLIEEINIYEVIYGNIINNYFATLLQNSELPAKISEYQTLIDDRPEITEEDMLYVEEIINNSMDKNLTLERDEHKILKILLSSKEILGKQRDELPLSSGEQNFLSLTFEFLKAKNSSCQFVVIDDPISSFDSIYKNKVVYAIIKMLHRKRRLVLTHNTDLLRLMESQYSYSFKLYLLNNTDGEENGFIALNRNEQKMLINLEKLLATFRNDIFSHIQNVELFLISMIPFMRGYANIINNSSIYDSLTQVMHGYKTEKIDVAQAYIALFGNKDEIIPESYEISVEDILLKTVDGIHVIDHTKYPLLDRTLQHSFTYLFLRLLVEKKLTEKYGIDTNENKLLGQIIAAAFPDENNITETRNRIRLTSKKTLLNEFNHFEGNLSIFQPAIDITDAALGKEKTDIITFLNNL